jgi:alkyl hydroperoxide reductase subunit AhpC
VSARLIDYSDLRNRNKSLSLRCINAYLRPDFIALASTNRRQVFMGIIGSTIKPFKATAFQAGKDFFESPSRTSPASGRCSSSIPADFTFVCPTELEDLGEHYEMLQKLGRRRLRVSTDTHFSHKAWHDTSDKIGKLNYAFLGDQMHTLSNNFGVLREGVGLPTARPSWSIPTA